MKLTNREFSVFSIKIPIKKSINLVLFLLTLNMYSQNLVPGGVTAGADRNLDCTTGSCTTLSANFHKSYETDNSYTVNSLPMDPVSVTLPSELDVDDGYSEVVDLDFTFCYFGEEYDQVQIGDNGTISFKVSYKPLTRGKAKYKIKPDWDCPHEKLPPDSVFGAYHDLLVPDGGEITYGITGIAPFRAFVVNYDHVAHWNVGNNSCNDISTTQQIVLHETSNYIDVYLTDKPACTQHQGGRAIVGIQKGEGEDGYAAPGRNASDGPWEVTNEAWRFAPTETGPETFTFEWVNNTTGMVESTDYDYDVCPTETTTYSASVTWINCVGETISSTDEVTVIVDLPLSILIDGGDKDFCEGDPPYSITTTATILAGVTIDSYNWYEASDPETSLGTSDNLTVSTSGTYIVNVTDSGGCTVSQSVDINYAPVPDAGTNGGITVCSSDTAIDLFHLIGGTPETGGIWSPTLTSGTGIFDPFIDTGGTYTYTLDGNGCPDVFSEVIVTLTMVANAGTDGSITVCAFDSSFDLFGLLGSTPDVGGTWSPVLVSGTGVFNPGVDAGGTYTYTLDGGGCQDVTSEIVVTLNSALDAGGDSSEAFCTTDTPFDLFTSLTGSPDTGGTWSPALASGTGVFNPGVDAQGSYTYTVGNTGPCPDDSAIVDVSVNAGPNAGTDGSVGFCTSDGLADLFTSLGGTPDIGGTWSPELESGTGIFNPSIDTAGTYTYVVAGGGCPDATATVDVTVNTLPDAGINSVIDLCTDNAAVDLFASLGGTPNTGGTWSPALTSSTGVFDPAIDIGGIYTYTVFAQGACIVDASATITVNLTTAPEAGLDTSKTYCSTDSSSDLFLELGGTPDLGGTWSPVLTSGTGVFDPAVDTSGVYTYTIAGLGVCIDDSATVIVGVDIAPVAGTNGVLELCTSNASLDLIVSLGGAPDVGGTWSPALTSGTGMFDPSVDTSGIYTYTVSNGVCTDAAAEVDVTVYTAADAGGDTTVTLCNIDSPLDLFLELGGTPDTNGTWSPSLTSGSGIFDPSVDAQGIYTYTIIGTGVCSDATAEIEIFVDVNPNAGINNAIEFCSTNVSIDLYTLLGGAPDTGGSWSPTLNSGTGMFNPATDSGGVYTYTVTNGVCSESSEMDVSLYQAPNAGTDGIANVCSSDIGINLFDFLQGTPDSGGTWSPVLNNGTGLFDPFVDANGIYTYTVSSAGTCIDATATVDITANVEPDAGLNAEILFCMSDGPVDLTTLLGGTPDLDGEWLPELDSGTGVFDPAIDTSGDYTYTVLGVGTCEDATAIISVSVSEAPMIMDVIIEDFSENNSVTVEVEGAYSGTPFGIGDFEYSLDGFDFQLSNFFENVAPGNYELTVTDTNGCLPDATRDIIVVGAPKFFTPNNDSYNDTWNIINLDPALLVDPATGVAIFDRFGKVIATIPAYSIGWDGYYNGEPLPSADYWFSVVVLDRSGNPVLKRGHFSLIRR